MRGGDTIMGAQEEQEAVEGSPAALALARRRAEAENHPDNPPVVDEDDEDDEDD